uniref:Expressed protein n=2 Tax=Oryza sativa subsp. japonica TaxID=39947 RepID=Q84R64_ORYSJ|nr:hypothetical protein [Oryza sativa Japonica Group]ABF98133.1 expressed protein [Oryza sativa Japonica Group]
MVQSLPARGAAGRRKKMGAWMSRVWFLMFPAKKYKIVVVAGKRWERACWGLEGVRPVENGMEAETEGARRQLRLLH